MENTRVKHFRNKNLFTAAGHEKHDIILFVYTI